MTLDEERLRERLEVAASQVRGDPRTTWELASRRLARRRRRRAAATTTAAVAVLVGGAALVPGLLDQPADEVALRDSVEETEDVAAPDVAPPQASVAEEGEPAGDAGWEVVALADDVSVEVPEAWDVHADPTTQHAEAFPQGPALVVDRQATPLGRPGADADWPEGIAVTSASAAPEVVGEVALKGEPVELEAGPARTLRASTPVLTDVGADGPVDLYVLPGVGDGLLLEVADPDGERAQEVLTRLEADEVDPQGLALGAVQGDDRVLAIDADGATDTWATLDDPDQPLALAPAPATSAERAVAAVRTVGDDVLVLSGDETGGTPTWRTSLGAGAEVDWHDGVGRTPVWSPDGTHLAWLADEERLRVAGWGDRADVVEGASPILDHTLPAEGLTDLGEQVALDRWVASEQPDLLVARADGSRDGEAARAYRGLRAQVDEAEQALLVPPEPAFGEFGELASPSVAAEDVSGVVNGDVEPVRLEGAEDGRPTVLESVRVGEHATFDRVVWELVDGDRPGVDVAYLEPDAQPRDPLSDEAVAVAGDEVLLVTLDRAVDKAVDRYAPDAEPYEGPVRLEGAEVVREVVRVGEADASITWAIGLDERTPFDVQVLEEPRRVVVDVGG